MAPEFVEAAHRRPICIDCGEPFPAAAGRDAALPPPERCATCRDRRRADRNAANLAGILGGRAPRRPAPVPGPGGRGPLALARCADCGRDIRVPFAPDASRPIFCRSCLSTLTGR